MTDFERFILIDDDVVFNFLNSTIIKKAQLGVQIDIYSKAGDALNRFQKALEAQEPVTKSIILLDINMPHCGLSLIHI